jgi:hypothetical protein
MSSAELKKALEELGEEEEFPKRRALRYQMSTTWRPFMGHRQNRLRLGGASAGLGWLTSWLAPRRNGAKHSKMKVTPMSLSNLL